MKDTDQATILVQHTLEEVLLNKNNNNNKSNTLVVRFVLPYEMLNTE